MAYIKLKENLPGIVGLIYYKRSTGNALCHFTQAGLRGPSPLTVTERELIATYVSSLNECNFCVRQSTERLSMSLQRIMGIWSRCAINNIETPGISSKMKALLNIAGKVQKSGRLVTELDIQARP